jgi:hypothetical protein
VRALRTARNGGMNPGMLEIETADGTKFRVFDLETVAATGGASSDWDTEIKKLEQEKHSS